MGNDATAQEEIKKIRGKYAPSTKEETSKKQLCRLDESATKGAAVVSLEIIRLSDELMK